MITEATIYTIPGTKMVLIATGEQPSAAGLIPVEAYFLSAKNGLVRNKRLDGHYKNTALQVAELVELSPVPAGEKLKEIREGWSMAV